ncbi:MAG: acetylxylan esterase [Planctomycetaceae bacterium]|nr:acetylxylan esterase [Planctomycetaceae bacterium]
MSEVFCYAQVPPANFDEAKIPNYVLPDPLLTQDGRKVDTPELWNEVRRPELLTLFENEMYGKSPLPVNDLESAGLGAILSMSPGSGQAVFNGKGTRYQARVYIVKKGETQNDDSPKIDILIYTPNNAAEKVPVFIGLNFRGNHTVSADPGINLGTVWRTPQGGWDGRDNIFVPHPAAEAERGSAAQRWQVEMLLDRGYALATVNYNDIEPDFDGGSKLGVRRLIEQKGEPNEGNAIATWAWGLGLIRNVVVGVYGESLNIDPQKVVVLGHSRLGKTALWAGAIDPNFAMVISNNSGSGGAALSKREIGETLLLTNTARPHWFCDNFKKHGRDMQSMPFDQHELIALIAPRPVYIASAVEDRWADPKGEFLSGLHADPVYRLLGTDGIAGVTAMPEIDRSVGGTIGYHVRTGVHDVTECDWEQFLNFADKHFRKP